MVFSERLRSPHEKLGGIVHLPRLLDKLRLDARGQLPEDYRRRLGDGFDARVCAFLRIDFDALRAAVREGGLDDAGALDWCRKAATWPDETALFTFNEFMRTRGWNDDLSPRLRKMSDAMGLDDEGSLQTAFDLLDADEGRPLHAPEMDRYRLAPLADFIAIFQRQARPFAPDPTGEEARLPRLEGNLANLGIRIATVRAHDWTQPAPAEWRGKFDAILLDVPCSNTGVMRRRLDARWRMQPEDMRALSDVQQSILINALPCLKPEGRIVYSTCSIEAEENHDFITRFIEQHEEWRIDAEHQALPQRDHTDGAYAARITRKPF